MFEIAPSTNYPVLTNGTNPAFASIGCSVVIWLHKVSRKHLSFMEHPRHDDVVRIVEIESD
jgi:hypothetical protein